MSEYDSMVVEIHVLSTTEIVINGKRFKSNDHLFQFTYDDLIDTSIVGFNRMHKKLEMMLASLSGPKKVKIEKLISLIANSSLTRLSHIEQRIGIPRYLAKKIFFELIDADACVMSGGALRKTRAYYEIIKDYNVKSKDGKYDDFVIPSELEMVPGSSTPPLCDWHIKDLRKLLEDAKAHGVKDTQLEGIVRQIQFKTEEEKEKRDERIAEIMKTRNVGKHDAEDIWEDEFINAQDQTKGGNVKDSEWDADTAESEKEEDSAQEKERTQRKKKKVSTKKKKK